MFIIPVKYSSTARDGQASTSLTSKRRRKKRTLHLVQSHSFWCACGCASVCASVCVPVCVSYLWVHLRHWAAGYAALKGCVSAAISPPPVSLVFSLPVSFCVLLFCFCLYGSPSPSICIPLSVLYHHWFLRTGRNVGGASRSQPFTSSTGSGLMLLEREAG